MWLRELQVKGLLLQLRDQQPPPPALRRHSTSIVAAVQFARPTHLQPVDCSSPHASPLLVIFCRSISPASPPSTNCCFRCCQVEFQPCGSKFDGQQHRRSLLALEVRQILGCWLRFFAFLDNLGYPPHSWIGFYFTIKFKWQIRG